MKPPHKGRDRAASVFIGMGPGMLVHLVTSFLTDYQSVIVLGAIYSFRGDTHEGPGFEGILLREHTFY